MFKLFLRLMEAAAAEGADGGGGGEDRSAIENRAKGMGWVPKDQWEGSPASWTDAPEYVQRGEQIMPLLRSNLRRTEAELTSVKTQLQKATAIMQAQQESLTILTQMNTKTNRDAAKDKRRELLRAQAQARKDENTDLEVEIGERIEEANQTIAAAEAEIEAEPTTTTAGKGKGKTAVVAAANEPVDPMSDPTFRAWAEANPWFGQDKIKTAAAVAQGKVLRDAGETAQGRAFFDKITVEINKIFEPHRRQTSKVEGGGNGGNGGDDGKGGGGGGGGRTFNDLDAEAKAVFKRQTPQMVGANRAFKTEAEWKKHYVDHYQW